MAILDPRHQFVEAYLVVLLLQKFLFEYVGLVFFLEQLDELPELSAMQLSSQLVAQWLTTVDFLQCVFFLFLTFIQ